MNEPLPDNVVISTINWNSENHTIKLIDSLLSANLENCKVVICDNGSSDSSYKNLKSHLLKMDWISQKKIEVESDQIESIQHLFVHL